MPGISPKPLRFSKTDAPVIHSGRGFTGRPRALPERLFRVGPAAAEMEAPSPEPHPDAGLASRYRIEPLVREWLLDVQVRGCSQRTIAWYAHKMGWFARHSDARTLAELTAFEFKRYLAEQQARGLSDYSVHGHFQVLKAFGNWACREGYPVDAALLRVRAPKVAQKEMESFTQQQIETVLREADAGWPRMAVEILLGTGMRVGELCALTLEDVEDDGDATFLKIKRGKGGKFRRVPVSRQLRGAAGAGPLRQPPAPGVRVRSAAGAVRRSAGQRRLCLPSLRPPPPPARLQGLRPQVPAHLCDRVPAPGRRDRAAAADPRPYDLRDGHALRPPGQGRPLPRLRSMCPLLIGVRDTWR